jgi:predicted dehydrogenase
MKDELGIAIIGCGYWGVNYIRLFEELAESRVVTVCDPQTERLQEISRRFPGIDLSADLDIALNKDGVDAVVVCTPATAHYEVSRRCLEVGKHVLVEKPITTTVTEAEDLINLADSFDLTLMVGHTFLYNSGVRKVKDYLGQSNTDQIYYLYAQRTNLGPIRRDVNAMWDLAPHDVSIFNYWLDSVPEWVSAVGVKALRNGHEDVGFASLGFQNGIVGHIHVSWADPNKVREIVVVGSERRIVFDDLNTQERVRVYEKGVTPASPEAPSYGEYHFLIRDGDIISPWVEVNEPLKAQCNHFVECVIHGHRPLTGGQAGLDVVRVMEAINRSIEVNGAPVPVQTNGTPISVRSNGIAVEAVSS